MTLDRGACAISAASIFLVCMLAGCAAAPTISSSPESTLDLTTLTTCREAFTEWVGGSGTLNTPGIDVLDAVVRGEIAQRRVFELCNLAEAEALNQELQIEHAPGFRQPLIEPDIRTFAEVECVDEGPLLDGTPLCNEVLR